MPWVAVQPVGDLRRSCAILGRSSSANDRRLADAILLSDIEHLRRLAALAAAPYRPVLWHHL